MLNVKSANDVRDMWEAQVSKKICEAQNKFETYCHFDKRLPDFIITQLESIGYTVRTSRFDTKISWDI